MIVQILKALIKFIFFKRYDVTILTEAADWVISKEAHALKKDFEAIGLSCNISSFARFIKTDILIFGSLNCVRGDLSRRKIFHSRKMAWIFHGDFGVSDDIDRQLKLVLNDKENFDVIFVANQTMYERMLGHGFLEEQLMIRPISTDGDIYPLCGLDVDARKGFCEDNALRDDIFLIGSFQKDGVGWGEGLEPKLIKGPDVFLEVCELIAQQRPIHVLLTGPARGYVKQGLKDRNLTFTHVETTTPEELIPYYSVLDLYVMASREEGGPKAITESLTLGVPIVATPTGVTDLFLTQDKTFVSKEFSAASIVDVYSRHYGHLCMDETRRKYRDLVISIFGKHTLRNQLRDLFVEKGLISDDR